MGNNLPASLDDHVTNSGTLIGRFWRENAGVVTPPDMSTRPKRGVGCGRWTHVFPFLAVKSRNNAGILCS